jgi:hypothetical protein
MNKKDKYIVYLDSKLLSKFVKKIVIPKDFNKNSQVIKDVVKHFKTEKYPLDINHIEKEIIREVLGFDIMSYVVKELNKRGLKISLGSKNGVLMIALDKHKKRKNNYKV